MRLVCSRPASHRVAIAQGITHGIYAQSVFELRNSGHASSSSSNISNRQQLGDTWPITKHVLHTYMHTHRHTHTHKTHTIQPPKQRHAATTNPSRCLDFLQSINPSINPGPACIHTCIHTCIHISTAACTRVVLPLVHPRRCIEVPCPFYPSCPWASCAVCRFRHHHHR
jgi:hypothetical protein